MDNLQPAIPNSSSPKYIPIEDIVYYSAKGYNNTQIAKEVGCNSSNISQRLNAIGYKPQRVSNYKSHKSEIFNFIQSLFINSLSSEEIKKAPIQVKLTGIGILEDKIQERKIQ